MNNFAFYDTRDRQKQALEEKRVGLVEQQIQNKQSLEKRVEGQKHIDSIFESATSVITAADIKKISRDDPNVAGQMKQMHDSAARTAVAAGIDPNAVTQRFKALYSSPTVQQVQASDASGAGLEAGAKSKAKLETGEIDRDKLVPVRIPGSDKLITAVKDERTNKFMVKKGDRWVEAPEGTVEYNKPSPTGTSEELGLGQNKLDTIVIERSNEKVNYESTVLAVQGLSEFVNSEDYVGGVTGNFLGVINSAYQQYKQVTGAPEIITGDRINEEHLNLQNLSKENLGWLREAAVKNDTLSAAQLELAFILARSLNPDGRISDKDVDAARRILSGSADKISTLQQLGQIQKRQEQRFLIGQREAARITKRADMFPLTTVQDIIGGEFNAGGGDVDADTFAADLLKGEGL